MADVNNRLQELSQGWASELLPVIPLSAGASATVNGPSQVNKYWLGMVLIVTTANRTSTITFTPTIQMLGPDGSTWINIWAAAAAIAANATTVYAFYAQSVLADFVSTEHKNIAIPRTFRVIATLGSTGTMDIRADAYMLP
jgi:hypothetical protein